MHFTFVTEYNQKAIRNMAYLMRKSIRKKKNRRSRFFGWLVVAAGILLTLPALRGEADIKANTILTWIAVLFIALTLLFEDTVNGFFARRRMLAGTDKAAATFEEDTYVSETAIGKTEFRYENIAMIAENELYFAFILDTRYAQLYDKSTLSGGTVDEFRAFISEKTKKDIIKCGKLS